jgi:bifunctional enzyme Fae/Hps
MLDRKKHYLQVALNSTLAEARQVIRSLPYSDRIIIEAGTPLIKRHGMEAISKLRYYWQQKADPFAFEEDAIAPQLQGAEGLKLIVQAMSGSQIAKNTLQQKMAGGMAQAYIVADLKCIDRGDTEVQIAAGAGASAAVVMGSAPVETVNTFIAACLKAGIDSMVDMMGVDQPIKVLRLLKKPPRVVILHRGVDETSDNKSKTLPIHQIAKVKGSYDVMIAIAGGDSSREVQSAVFNGANIVVVWKDFYQQSGETKTLAENFLKQTR